VSDEDRERTVQALRTNLIEGRLTLDEFADRAGLAYSAKIGADLIQITSDLPSGAIRSAPTNRRASRVTLAIFARLVRSGRMRLRRRTTAISVFADIDLDLRRAEIDSERTTVNVFAVFGNVDVYVPAGINVDVGGVTVGGHRRTWGHLTGPQTAPVVYVRSMSLFGTVDIWHVPANMAGDYKQIVRELKRRHGELAP
jgi:hypothetical protein